MRLPLALAALAISASVFAQQTPPAPPAAPPLKPQPFATIVTEPAAMLIAACDTNFDAIVTRDELHSCLKRSFDGVAEGKPDIGYIDYGQWALRWLGDQNALPSPYTVDMDNNDRITLAELTAQFDILFDRYDIDKNGSLTRAELLTIRTPPPSPPPGKRGKKGK